MSATPHELVLRERARRLAAPILTERDTRARDMLIVRVTDERYAVNLNDLVSVQTVHSLTAVPCTPAVIAGVMNVRGDILTILDLGSLLGLPETDASTDARVILAETRTGCVGLLVDEVLGVETLRLDSIEPSNGQRDFVRGTIGAHTVILDLQRLLESDRLVVHEEVS